MIRVICHKMGKGQKSKFKKKLTQLHTLNQMKLIPFDSNSVGIYPTNNSEIEELSDLEYFDDFPVYANSTKEMNSFGDSIIEEIGEIDDDPYYMSVQSAQSNVSTPRTYLELPEDYPPVQIVQLPYRISPVKRAFANKIKST